MEAPRDENFVPALLATLNSNGKTLVRVYADETRHSLKMSNGTTGTNRGPLVAPRDQNFVPALLATSSSDGVTPVVVYADSSGNLLVTS